MNNFFAFLIIFGFILTFLGIFGLCIADYIISSLGLYRLAKRRVIKKPWLSWIPGVNCWTVGSIVDDYDQKNGVKRKWRVVLLVLFLICLACVVIYTVAFGAVMDEMMGDMYYALESDFWGAFAGMYVAILVTALSGTALMACQMVCLFKVFESTVPKKAVKYLLLSLLVPLAEAICLLWCSDEGYSNEVAEDAVLIGGEIPEKILPAFEEIAEQSSQEETSTGEDKFEE